MESKSNLPNFAYFFLLIFLVGILAPADISAEDIKLSSGQTVYVSIYSHIYSGVKGRPFALSATLSLRNTNLKIPITLTSVKYYDSDGKLGGSGANFIVVWKSDQKVNPPIIEAVMIGTHSGQGISFASRGQVIKEDR